ncbi:hypothetical protein BDR07DRAFT_1379840 [Suillus spraguei]|nr:hypothetical protein BDR07DRAFT_1379840 [Suillus spraguei]
MNLCTTSFFSLREIGWGISHIIDIPNFSQIDWTEEQWLAYIAKERQRQAYKMQENEDDIEEFEPSIKLPASFVGSHVWTSEQTADAMALGRKFGKLIFLHYDIQSRLARSENALATWSNSK